MHFYNKVPSLLNPSFICHFPVINTFSLHLSFFFFFFFFFYSSVLRIGGRRKNIHNGPPNPTT